MKRRSFLKSTAAGAVAATVGVAAAPSLFAQSSSATGNDFPKETIDAIKKRITLITSDERHERIERARRLMAEQKIDALLMEGGINLGYYTGAQWGRSERLFAMILPRKGDPVFVAPKFEEARAHEQTGSTKVLTWDEHESPYALIKSALAAEGISTGTIGIEETTRFFVSDNLAKTAGTLTLVSATPVTAGCRCVKTAHELDLMQIANDITREVFTASLSHLKAGMKEREFATVISQLYRQFGVGGGALVLFGEASAYPHGSVKDHVLSDGDIVLIDGGCEVEGYSSDVTRTTTFGKPSEKTRTVWEIVRKAQDTAMKTARPGLPSEQVDAAARKVISDAGYGPDYKYFSHRLGHGIGLEGHEWYYLVRGNTRPLETSNTFSDEPGIYIPGEFGIRIEDELLITADGARLMLPAPPSIEKIFP